MRVEWRPGIAGLRRMKREGRQGILARALIGVALNGVLLGLMVWLAGFLIYDAQRAARERERAADLEAQQLTAHVGGGAALEKALVERTGQNFALALRELQKNYDSAWAALTNPPGPGHGSGEEPGRIARARGGGAPLDQGRPGLAGIHRQHAGVLPAGIAPAQAVAGGAGSGPAKVCRGPRRRQSHPHRPARRGGAPGRGRFAGGPAAGRDLGPLGIRPATRHSISRKPAGRTTTTLPGRNSIELSGQAQSLQEQLPTRNP